MELADAHRALRVLTASFPTYPFGEDTQEVYLGALMSRVESGPDAFDAVRAWVYGQDRFPTVSQLLAACRLEARRRTRSPLALVAGKPADAQIAEAARLVNEARDNLRSTRPKGDTG